MSDETRTNDTLPEDPYSLQLTTADGKPQPLSDYRGKVLLIVNVASKCGFTPQYAGLQDLHEKYESRGLVVLGVPSNDFGGQEPGSNAEIQTFCSNEYGVTFPVMAKEAVTGEQRHPLYAWLSQAGKVKWNFTKFLVGRDGRIIEHYGSSTKPEDDDLVSAIEAALGSG